jgi:hypothetical protein
MKSTFFILAAITGLISSISAGQDGIEEMFLVDDDFEEIPPIIARAAGFGHQSEVAGSGSGTGNNPPPLPPFLRPNALAPAPPKLPLEEEIRFTLIKILTESNPGTCPLPTCDPRMFSDCTCVDPVKYTSDGRGNCNFGSSKADKRVWCYVDPSKHDPRSVCPDARPSSSEKGWFWSRMACLT